MTAPTDTRPLIAFLDRLCDGVRAWAVIAAVLVACALPGLISLPPLDRDESRFVQATTQMFESGDFVRISFQDEPRNKKPVGIHWMQATARLLTGTAEARIVQVDRAVSLAGALLAAFAVFWIGARLVSRRVGLVAAVALGASLLLSTEAGIAKTDAMLAGTVALAYAGLAALRTPRAGQPLRGAHVFWIGLALAVLVKGPVGALVLGLSLVMLAVWERDVRWMRGLLDLRAIALGALIAVPWHVAIWLATDGAFFRDAIGQDLAPKLSGDHENAPVPPGAHLLLSPVLLFPGSILLAAAVWQAWTGRRDPVVRFLVAWVVPGWLMFEAAPAKLAHYTLPVHGGLMLLGALGLMAGAWTRGWVRWTGLALCALGGLVLAAAPALLAADLAPERSGQAMAAGAVMGGVLLVALALTVRRSRWAGVALVACAVVSSVALKGVFLGSLPALDVSRSVSAALQAEGLHPRLSPGQPGPLVGAGYQEPSLIYLTRSDSALSSPAAAAAAARAGSGAVVEAGQEEAVTAALAARGLGLSPAIRTVSGLNYSKGDPVRLGIHRIVALNAQRPAPD